MGADLVGLAYPFLQAAVESADAVEARLRRTIRELTICMFCTGSATLRDLGEAELQRRGGSVG